MSAKELRAVRQTKTPESHAKRGRRHCHPPIAVWGEADRPSVNSTFRWGPIVHSVGTTQRLAGWMPLFGRPHLIWASQVPLTLDLAAPPGDFASASLPGFLYRRRGAKRL